MYGQAPFESIEKEYLYHVNIDSERKMEGTTIMDYPLKQLYGIRVIDDNEEFVFLESETGITERLDDQLLEKCSENAEVDGKIVKYSVDSEVYMGSSGYTFEFDDTTGQLKEVRISWLP